MEVGLQYEILIKRYDRKLAELKRLQKTRRGRASDEAAKLTKELTRINDKLVAMDMLMLKMKVGAEE